MKTLAKVYCYTITSEGDKPRRLSSKNKERVRRAFLDDLHGLVREGGTVILRRPTLAVVACGCVVIKLELDFEGFRPVRTADFARPAVRSAGVSGEFDARSGARGSAIGGGKHAKRGPSPATRGLSASGR